MPTRNQLALTLYALMTSTALFQAAPVLGNQLPFAQQIQTTFNETQKGIRLKSSQMGPDNPLSQTYEHCQDLDREIRNDNLEKAKAISTSFETSALQFSIPPSTPEHDEIASTRSNAIQLGNTASWLDDYSRGKPNESSYVGIAESLYRAAYILNIKCGFLDHFTVLYLHRLCDLLNRAGKHEESTALWHQARLFLATNAAKYQGESLSSIKRAQSDMDKFESAPQNAGTKTNAVVSMISTRIEDADILEQLEATDASKVDLCQARIKVADWHLFDKETMAAIPLVEKALLFLESSEGQATASNEELNQALESLTFELARNLDKCPGELLRRACKISETREPEGTKNSLINNLVEDKYASDSKSTDACLATIDQIIEVRQKRDGLNSPTLEHALEGLVRVNRLAKRYDDALSCQQKVIDFLKINEGKTFYTATDGQVTLTELLAEAGKFDQARVTENQALEQFNKELAESHNVSRPASDLGNLAVVYAKLKRPDDCDRVIREALTIANKLRQKSERPEYPYQTSSLVTYIVQAYRTSKETKKAISLLQFVFDNTDDTFLQEHNSWRYTLAQLYLEESSAMKAAGNIDEKQSALMLQKSKQLFDRAQIVEGKREDRDPERIAELVQARQDVLNNYGKVLSVEEHSKLASTKQPILSKQEIESYRLVYKNPQVIHLREAMDAALAGKGRSDEQKIFAHWDKSYLGSKFVVLSIDRGLMGGNFISIIFQDKPDKVFRAWLYTKSKENIEVRTFDDAALPEEELNEITTRFGPYISDKALSI